LCEHTLPSPCARMSGDRAYLSSWRTPDRAAADGASLAATGGRVRGHQRAAAPADRERAAGRVAATADSAQGRRQAKLGRRYGGAYLTPGELRIGCPEPLAPLVPARGTRATLASRGPSSSWIPSISAFTRVHSPPKTGVNALNDALCVGMSVSNARGCGRSPVSGV